MSFGQSGDNQIAENQRRTHCLKKKKNIDKENKGALLGKMKRGKNII